MAHPSRRSNVTSLAARVLQLVAIDPAAALRVASECLALARASPERDLFALAQARLGRVYLALKQYENAIACYLEALELFRELLIHSGEVDCLNALGAMALDIGDHAQALLHFEAGLAVALISNRPELEGRLRSSLAVALSKLARHDEAFTQFAQALTIYRRLNHVKGVLSLESNLALEYIAAFHRATAAGDGSRATQMLQAAKRSLSDSYQESRGRQSSDPDFRRIAWDAYLNSLVVLRLEGQFDRAIEGYKRQRARAADWDRLRWLMATLELAETQLEVEDFSAAEGLLTEALPEPMLLERPKLAGRLYGSLSRCYRADGRFQAALEAFEKYHECEARFSSLEAQRVAAGFEARLQLESARLQIEKERARISELSAEKSAVEQRNRELDELALRDPGTKLPNKRALEDFFLRVYESAKVRSLPLSLVVLDIDRFKAVNDTYGHDVGDLVLAALAQIISESLRPDDFAARFGGEEFCVVLPGRTSAQALDVAERLRQAVEAFDWDVKVQTGLALTASFGVCGDLLGSRQAMFKAADGALYAAKRGGRNRVSVWQVTPSQAVSNTADRPVAVS